MTLDSVKVSGFASPDGTLPKNKELSLRRAISLRNYLNQKCGIADSLLIFGTNIVPWELFREIISASDYSWRRDALRIMSIGSDDNTADNTRRMNRLKKLANGQAWHVLKSDILPQLRSALAVTSYATETDTPETDTPATPASPSDDVAVPELQDSVTIETHDFAPSPAASIYPADGDAVTYPTPLIRSWRLLTNALEWGMFIGNIEGEWDFDEHWSANLSLHYSALNYFTSTQKFRTFIVRPQLRYWLKSSDCGLFVDVHLQMAAYNFALSRWDYRIQDVGGKHPALGGGVGLGYRHPIDKSGRWAVEAAVGVGVYHLKYNRFENRPNGQLVDTRSRTWFGIDNVAISLVYKFQNPASR